MEPEFRKGQPVIWDASRWHPSYAKRVRATVVGVTEQTVRIAVETPKGPIFKNVKPETLKGDEE